MMDENFDVELTTNAYGGEGMGRLPDGRAVFVPYAAAGEKVRIRLVEEKPRYARGEIVELLQSSPERVQPACPHFGVCGGCHYQMLPYANQLEMKKGILRDQMERLAGLKTLPEIAVIPSPMPLQYRNHIQFHLDGAGRLGFHRNQSNAVVAIRECHLWLPEIGDVWPALDFGEGFEDARVGLRADSLGDLQLILESEDMEAPEMTVEEIPLSVVHIVEGGELVMAGSPYAWMEIKGRQFRVSAGSFFQVNLAVAEKMLEHVLGNIADESAGDILDLYSGVGLFSAFAAGKTRRLVAIENSPSACDDFVFNLEEFDHVELYESAVEDALPSIGVHPEVVIADPPRAGLGRVVVNRLISLDPKKIIYVSCDPATMARDTKNLAAGGYRLVDLSLFDMFPQTYHLETVGVWVKG